MEARYGKAELSKFLTMLSDKGLANTNTAQALRVATAKILADLSPEEEADVRKIDVAIAVRRFHNKSPGTLSPKSLGEYERRVSLAIREFVRYNEKPTAYAAFGRGRATNRADGVERSKTPRHVVEPPKARTDVGSTPTPAPTGVGLSLSFPLRPDFLAQVVIPRDLKTEEAKRLGAFISTLALDYSPN